MSGLTKIPKLDIDGRRKKMAAESKEAAELERTAIHGDGQKDGIKTPNPSGVNDHPASVTSSELDLDTETEPEDRNYAKEVGANLTAGEKTMVAATLKMLQTKGINLVRFAGKKAKFYSIDNPDVAPSLEAAAAADNYPDNLSKNDAFYFEPGEAPVGRDMPKASGQKMVLISAQQLNTIVRNATEVGAVNAIDFIQRRSKRATIEETNQSKSKTDMQGEIENSDTPTNAMVEAVPFERTKPEDIKALEHVDELPFDDVNPEEQKKGRQLSRVPADS